MCMAQMLRSGAALLVATASVATAASDVIEVSDLLGSRISMPPSELEGEIKDVVLDMRDGQVEFLVYTLDGETFATSIDGLSRGWTDGRFKLDASSAEALGIAADRRMWPASLERDNDSFVNDDTDADGEHGLKRVKHIMRASRLIDCDVENWSGESLGELDDVVVSLTDGGSAYGILASGGFLGMGEDHFAIPLETIRYGEGKLIVAADVADFDEARQLNEPFPRSPAMAITAPEGGQDARRDVAAAKTLDEDSWRDTTDTTDESNENHHARRIYVWTPYAIPKASDSALASRVRDRPDTRIVGTIIDVSHDGYFSDKTRDGLTSEQVKKATASVNNDVWLTVRTKTGPIYDVLVAPKSFLDGEDFEASHRAVVTVDGTKLPWGGNVIFVANSIEMGDRTFDLRDEKGGALWSGTER